MLASAVRKQDLQDGDGACNASGHTCSYKIKVIQEGILVLISCAIYDLSRTQMAQMAAIAACRALLGRTDAEALGCMLSSALL